jgi:FMN phosphatase YigB (HAD superfamily)
VGVASIGPAVKDWEKLIRLNLHHIFHIYKVGLSSWSELFQELDPSTTILVSANPSGIAEASRAGARTVRLLRGRFSHIRSKEADREVKDIWGILSAVKSLSEGL